MAPVVSKFIRYSAASIPGFLLSLGLNVLLVEALNTPKPVAYGFVLWTQITYGFFANRVWVFKPDHSTPLRRQYFQWVSGIALFRAADWAVYMLLVTAFGLNYVIAQVADSLLFTFLKFAFAKRLFEGQTHQRAH